MWKLFRQRRLVEQFRQFCPPLLDGFGQFGVFLLRFFFVGFEFFRLPALLRDELAPRLLGLLGSSCSVFNHLAVMASASDAASVSSAITKSGESFVIFVSVDDAVSVPTT